MDALSVYKTYFDALNIVIGDATTYDSYHELLMNTTNLKCDSIK
jgi:hypothetical protein